MKKLIMITLMFSTPVLAGDFDSQFAAFQKDFDRLNSMVITKKQKKPKTVVVKMNDEQEMHNEVPDENEVDPTSPDRLGHQLENPVMREKVAALYQKPNIKVYSYVLQAE